VAEAYIHPDDDSEEENSEDEEEDEMDAIDLVQYFLFVYLNKELIHWQNVVNCNH